MLLANQFLSFPRSDAGISPTAARPVATEKQLRYLYCTPIPVIPAHRRGNLAANGNTAGNGEAVSGRSGSG